jgi:hypothetical protein
MGFDAGSPKFLSVSLNAMEYGLEMSINVPSKSKARAVIHNITLHYFERTPFLQYIA